MDRQARLAHRARSLENNATKKSTVPVTAASTRKRGRPKKKAGGGDDQPPSPKRGRPPRTTTSPLDAPSTEGRNKQNTTRHKSKPEVENASEEDQDGDNDDDDEDVYVVSQFVDERPRNGGGRDLKVRWEGFSEKEDTWEKFEDVAHCRQALVQWAAVCSRAYDSAKRIRELVAISPAADDILPLPPAPSGEVGKRAAEKTGDKAVETAPENPRATETPKPKRGRPRNAKGTFVTTAASSTSSSSSIPKKRGRPKKTGFSSPFSSSSSFSSSSPSFPRPSRKGAGKIDRFGQSSQEFSNFRNESNVLARKICPEKEEKSPPDSSSDSNEESSDEFKPSGDDSSREGESEDDSDGSEDDSSSVSAYEETPADMARGQLVKWLRKEAKTIAGIQKLIDCVASECSSTVLKNIRKAFGKMDGLKAKYRKSKARKKR